MSASGKLLRSCSNHNCVVFLTQQHTVGDGYIRDDLQTELETWKKNFLDVASADDQLRAMESRTAMLRAEVDRLQKTVKVRWGSH